MLAKFRGLKWKTKGVAAAGLFLCVTPIPTVAQLLGRVPAAAQAVYVAQMALVGAGLLYIGWRFKLYKLFKSGFPTEAGSSSGSGDRRRINDHSGDSDTQRRTLEENRRQLNRDEDKARSDLSDCNYAWSKHGTPYMSESSLNHDQRRILERTGEAQKRLDRIQSDIRDIDRALRRL
jgi:hypothetical protein